LPCHVTPTTLPDVMQDRDAVLPGQLGHTIDQWIVGPATRGELDADHSRAEAAPDLALGVGAEVGVYGDVAADTIGMLALEGQQRVVAVGEVGGRREVG